MRLITRSDFDGLVCAVLLKQVEEIDEIVFAHPKDVQDGKITVTSNDIITNLPYVDGVGKWFDHHHSENSRIENKNFEGRLDMKPSSARVVAEYYGSDKFTQYEGMLEAVDRVDSANLTFDEIVNPQDWIILAYIMDSRTGMGYHKEYRISNYEMMMQLVDMMTDQSIGEIMKNQDVEERIQKYKDDQLKFHILMRDNSKMHGSCVVTDLRDVDEYPTGNRFLIYSIFPESNISIRVFNGRNKENVVFALGYSILNKSSKVDIGNLMLRYGGGGHVAAGTCQVEPGKADKVLSELIEACK